MVKTIGDGKELKRNSALLDIWKGPNAQRFFRDMRILSITTGELESVLLNRISATSQKAFHGVSDVLHLKTSEYNILLIKDICNY